MTAAETLASPVRASAGLTRVIIAASIGNALEWFDFLVYGYFAVTIAKVFFPAANETIVAGGARHIRRLLPGASFRCHRDRHGYRSAWPQGRAHAVDPFYG